MEIGRAKAPFSGITKEMQPNSQNSETLPFIPSTHLVGKTTLVIAVNLTIWHQAIWCSGSQNCKFGPYNMEIGCSCLNQIDTDEQPK